MPGPLLALAGRLAATRGGAAVVRAGAAGGRAARAAKARVGRAIGPKGRKLARKYGKKARRELDLMGDLYSDQWNRDRGNTGPKAARAIRKAELLRGVLGGKKYFSGKGGAEAGPIPAKKTPKTAKEVTKPSISAINDQLGDLLRIVTHIRDISKDRQNTLLKNEVDAVRASDEEHLESNVAANDNDSPDALPEPANDNNANELSNAFDTFSQALDSLTQTIQDLIDNQGGDEEEQQRSFGDLFMENFRRGKGYKGTRFSPGSIVGKSQARLSGLATNVKQSAAVRTIGNVIKTGAGAAASKAARGAGATRDVVRKLARPIIAKSLGKTALKSIPLIGAVAGVGFAIGKLLDGDFVGAGLEATSGLAGPATAIPAFLLSVSRDIYSGVYGVPPEQDPLFSERMPEIEEAVKAEAASIMSPQVETKEGVTTSSGGQATGSGNPQQQMQEMAQKAAAPAMAGAGASSSPPPAPSSGGAGGGGGAPPSATPAGGDSATPGGAPALSSGSPPPTPTEEKPNKGSGASPSGNATDGLNEAADPGKSSSEAQPPSAQPASLTQAVSAASDAGAKIMQATEKSEEAANKTPMINVGRDGQRPRPQRFPTERQGFTGTGNVPNPGLDNMGTIAYQLYFGVAA
jgi:hypothetical protein